MQVFQIALMLNGKGLMHLKPLFLSKGFITSEIVLLPFTFSHDGKLRYSNPLHFGFSFRLPSHLMEKMPSASNSPLVGRKTVPVQVMGGGGHPGTGPVINQSSNNTDNQVDTNSPTGDPQSSNIITQVRGLSDG